MKKKIKVPNSGRKQRYGEPTKVVPFRIPISKVDYVKQLIEKLKDKWSK